MDQHGSARISAKTGTHQDPNMIRVRLTTRSGSWFSPISRHATPDLITYPRVLVQTSSHLCVHVHVYRSACCRCMGYFSLSPARTNDVGVRTYTMREYTQPCVARISPTCEVCTVCTQHRVCPDVSS